MNEAIREAGFTGALTLLGQLLGTENATADAVNEDLTSPLMLASVSGHFDCVKLLVKHGAFVNARRCVCYFIVFFNGEKQFKHYIFIA